jgi:tRNA nucleotidyltransferase (CCA-adding enzyme)
MQIFLVGGAVRDKLLNYPSSENDWVVIGARPQDMIAKGYSAVGKDFPVFLHPETKEEYALARKERKIAAGYTGFDFNTDPDITLEEDLSRRDLTINAIAESEDGELIDPYGGQQDLRNKILRHVSPAFVEDPLRILRVARFAARYHHLGFRIADETLMLMRDIVESGEVDALIKERIWKEFERALSERSPQTFITVLRDCGALSVVMPEIDALFGVPQPALHHPEIDSGVHSLMALEQASALSENTQVRFASLVHDLGKALTPQQQWPKHHGHEDSGLGALERLCDRIAAPNDYRQLAELVMRYHTHSHRAFELKAQTLLKLFRACDAFRRPERFSDFLISCKADARGRKGKELENYPQANYLLLALNEVSNVSAKQFIEQGLKGAEIGSAIEKARLNVLKIMVKHLRASSKGKAT